MIRTLALLPLAAMVIACMPIAEADSAGQTPASNEVAMPEDDMQGLPIVCNAARVQNLVGQRHTEALAKDAMARSNVRSMRLIRPGMAVTMDFRTDRLNIEVDAESVITVVRCG